MGKMSYNALATTIKTQLETISTIEKVQDYGRHTVDWDKIAELFKDSNNRIHAWIIEWNNVDPELIATGSRAISYPHNMTLWGLFGLKDTAETQKTLQTEVDAVLDLFNGQKDLIDSVTSTIKYIMPDDDLCSLTSIDHATFSGVLCNRAQVNLSYEELRSYV
jgi:hypothetical protein